MNISAKIIEDSISGEGIRLTTLQLCYPRFIHAEFMTHRVFSRNASSSRAIPVAKMIEQVRTDPAMPVHWGANQPGMQAKDQLIGIRLAHAKAQWINAALAAANTAELMESLGLHKQVANRILEPFQWIHVIVTATEWDNFFELRIHPDAQPEIQLLATEMKIAMDNSSPNLLGADEWHLPYVTGAERDEYLVGTLRKLSAARCARVSYLTHDKKEPYVDADLALYHKLIVMKPMHASPVEHQATPDYYIATDDPKPQWSSPELHGNLRGWIQFRKQIPDHYLEG